MLFSGRYRSFKDHYEPALMYVPSFFAGASVAILDFNNATGTPIGMLQVWLLKSF